MPADPTVHPDTSTGQERAADSITRDLEKRIATGQYRDGLPLPAERELMVEYGASRTVIREAVTALASQGLIENRPRFRPIVRKPGYEAVLGSMQGVVKHLLGEHSGVKNLYASRVFVERMLVRDAATDARKAHIEQLTAALTENKAAIDDSVAFYASDMAFHEVLYQIPGNPIFPALHKAYTDWLHPHWIHMPRSPERNYVNYRSHEAIYSAIVARDPDGAEAALSSHLNAAWEYVRVTFDERASSDAEI